MTTWTFGRHEDGRHDDEVWTIGPGPSREHWATASGCSGYGMSFENAEFAARCVNYVLQHARMVDLLSGDVTLAQLVCDRLRAEEVQP